MKRLALVFIGWMFVLAGCQPAGKSSTPSVPAIDYRKVQTPALRPFEAPTPRRVELENGMTVFLLEDRSLPTVRMTLTAAGGSAWEPADKTGLASLTGTVMRSGGTTSIGPDELDEKLESMGASLESSIGLDAATVGMFVLKEDFDDGLGLFLDLLHNPAFPQEKIDLAKSQVRSAISRRNDSPSSIISREYDKVIYGPGSPYARTPEYATIDRIARDDLVRFHRETFVPDRAFLAVAGDFDGEEMLTRLKKEFSSWKRGGKGKPELPDVSRKAPAKIYIADKPELNQTSIRIGHLGIRRTPDNRDLPALSLFSEILGSGFSSRLMNEVRSKKGYAYSVWGYYITQYGYPGTFTMGADTKVETTYASVEAMLSVLEGMLEKPVEPHELELAKESFRNSFVFLFDTIDENLEREVRYARYGFPSDYYKTFFKRADEVTAEEILRVARKYIRPEELAVVLVGNRSAFDEPAALTREVELLDITIPEPPREKVDVGSDAEGVKRGGEILRKAIAKVGTEETLRKVKGLRWEGTTERETPMGPIPIDADITVRLPDAVRMEQVTPMGSIVLGIDGEETWMKGPDGTARNAPPAMGKMLASLLDQVEVRIFRRFLDGELKAQHAGEVEVDGAPCDKIRLVDDKGEVLCEYAVSRENRRILAKWARMQTPQGPVKTETRFSDFKTVEGLEIPHSEANRQDGEEAGKTVYRKIRVNPELPEDWFSKK